MNQVKAIIKSTTWLLSCLLVVLSASCSSDDESGMYGSGTASLQITVTAREEGDLNSRAAGDTETGTTGEFMNDNLVVFLVDANNQVALKLTPDLTANTAAQQGNLKTWVSDEITIATGTYTAYAFANIDDTYYTGWSDIVNINEGDTFDASTFNSIILDDPAGKIDFTNGHYIPLSATPITVSVTAATTGISIGLDRLVGKVRAAIKATAGIEVETMTFSGYADKVSLMSGVSISDVSYTLSKTIAINQTIPEAGSITIDDFYVNETSGNPFTINVTTAENMGVTYTATTTTTDIPRNYIFPLTLQLNESELVITATVFITPIGTTPIPVTAISDSKYNVTIPTGCTFEFAVSVSEGVTPTATWTFAEDYTNYIYFDGDVPTSVTGTTATGACSADDTEDSYTIYIDAAWTIGTKTYTRTYTLVVNVTNDWDAYLDQVLNAATRGFVGYTQPEILTMYNIAR